MESLDGLPVIRVFTQFGDDEAGNVDFATETLEVLAETPLVLFAGIGNAVVANHGIREN